MQGEISREEKFQIFVFVKCSQATTYYFIVWQVKLSSVISTSEARGAVEKWLLQVQDIMLLSVRDVVEASYAVSI